MALKFKQNSGVKQAKEVKGEQLSALASTVQEYIDLGRQIDNALEPIKPLQDKQAGLKKIILSEMSNHPADKKVTIQGYDDTIEGSANSKKTSISEDNELILGVLGEELFVTLATFKSGDLKKYVDDTMLAKITSIEQTGARRLKIK